MAQVINTTNTSNIVIRTSSAIGMIEGNGATNAVTTRNSFNNTKLLTDTSLTSIFTLQNNETFQSKQNRVRVRLDFLSLLGTANQNIFYSIVKNATLGGTPSFTNISPNTSVISVDVAGTSVTNGTTLITFAAQSPGSAQIPLSELESEINPGDTFTIAAQSTGATTSASAAISWLELW